MKTTKIIVTKEVEITAPESWRISELEELAEDICTNRRSLDRDWKMDNIEYESKTISIRRPERGRGAKLTTGRFDTREELIDRINFMYWSNDRSVAACARSAHVSETTAAKLIMSKTKWEEKCKND